MARWAPTGEPTFFTQLSQVLGDSWPWQTLKTLLPLGYNNSVRDLVLRNSWGRGSAERKEQEMSPSERSLEPEGPCWSFPACDSRGYFPTWPGLDSCSSASVSQSLFLSPFRPGPWTKQKSGIHSKDWSVMYTVGRHLWKQLLWKQKITSLPGEELVELLEVSTLTIGDWNLDYHLSKKEDLVHSFSLIHSNK